MMSADTGEADPVRQASDPVSAAAAAGGSRSLEGLHGTVPLPPASAGFWRQYRAFVGPAILISVGYMDPGNWGTDLQAGAQFRYQLLWVVGLASLMAIIMQVIAARLGVVTGKDLAQFCRDNYPEWSRLPLWIFCEIAIGACDLAEVVGSAVALKLLFHVPLFWAVLITAFDVLLLLGLQGLGMRFIEAIVLVLVITIGGCYFIEIFVLPQTQPSFVEMGGALLTPGFREQGMIVVAIGIIGATVMPHNLYLHSALVHSRQLQTGDPMIRRALQFNTIDTVVALSIAFFVNAAILVLAALVFHGKEGVRLPSGAEVKQRIETEIDPDTGEEVAKKTGVYFDPTTGEEVVNDIDPQTGAEVPNSKLAKFNDETDWIMVAFFTLAPLLGTALASILYAVALLASGQSSTITGTLAGQVVMEGFMHLRIRPWIRRLITRSLAIIPAILIIGVHGDGKVTDLLVLSQVVLAMQLPFAMFPLLHFTSSRKWMGRYRNGWFLLVAGWTSALLITALDLWGLPQALQDAWKVITGHS
jgi:manganese transport protein